MKYLCLVYHEEATINGLPASEFDTLVGDATDWMEGLKRSGHHVFSAGLHAAWMATIIRSRNEKVFITDGPVAETKEQLGGLAVIDATDLDEAIRLAAKLAAITQGCVEVRPIDELIARGCYGLWSAADSMWPSQRD